MTALVTHQPFPPHVLATTSSTSTLPRRRMKRRGTSATSTSSSPRQSSFGNLVIAVGLWYTLGILSISTTKILLEYEPPLVLTLQQLCLGSTILRFWNRWNPQQEMGLGVLSLAVTRNESSGTGTPTSRYFPLQIWESAPYLFMAAASFTFGFLATNFGFGASSASFVETIKAAEPLSSAALAVGFGLEDLSGAEWGSLGGIVLGVVCSTLGNSRSTTTSSTTTLLSQSLASCAIVMLSNLCFSLRGLYQKWFQAKKKLDAWTLQFIMQQLGVWLLTGPVFLFHGLWIIQSLPYFSLRLLALALINGMAFTSYNLASTYLLTKITVVHHAALNCIRRIFAIVVTSIIFQVPITIVGALGILISTCGFMAFSYAKAMKPSPKGWAQRQAESSRSCGSSISNDSDIDLESYTSDKDRRL